MNNNFFSINNFSCGYGKKFKIHDINFSIKKGSFAGIIGPNGSGKTTLFKGIAGELKPLSGNIFLDKKNMANMRFKEKARNLAIVSQRIDNENINVTDYVLMGRIPYKKYFSIFETKDDYLLAEKYMKMTNVWQLKDKNMNQLSGGQQQLVSIAKALTQEPNILLLDEPTSHLDITHQIQVLNLIQKLNKELQLTVLMIIHDLNLAGEYCDYLIMMNKGTVFTKNIPDNVLTYSNIENVYKTIVVTGKNPVSEKPTVFLVSEKGLNKNSFHHSKYNES